jgi:hypothetical protein
LAAPQSLQGLLRSLIERKQQEAVVFRLECTQEGSLKRERRAWLLEREERQRIHQYAHSYALNRSVSDEKKGELHR